MQHGNLHPYAGQAPSQSSAPAWLSAAKSALRGRSAADAAAADAAARLRENLAQEQRVFTELDGIIYMKLLNPLQVPATAPFSISNPVAFDTLLSV